ncbi:MAG TPA: phosphatase PAP2 family protein [Acetobacteraceae bacterium]|nr:phosphatase PAP2 family protein [Acetobacteraceae bacterium]
MNYVTDFADQAVVLPVALAIGLALLAQKWWAGALAWSVTIIGTFAAMLLLKLLLIPCGAEQIHTPSGHVAAATVVTGGLAAMLRRRRGVVLPVALLTAVIIGASRLVLEVHTWPEVTVGALVGMAGASLMPRLAGAPPPSVNFSRLVLIAVLVAVVFHGLHMPAEAEIHSTAWRLAHYLGVCRA